MYVQPLHIMKRPVFSTRIIPADNAAKVICTHHILIRKANRKQTIFIHRFNTLFRQNTKRLSEELQGSPKLRMLP
jgi:hypothetical protein